MNNSDDNMVSCDIQYTDSKMNPLKNLVIELLNSNDELIDIRKTDVDGKIYFDSEKDSYVFYAAFLPDKYTQNQGYREMISSQIRSTHTHIPLMRLDENRYIIRPVDSKRNRINNIVCTWYDKNGKVIGEPATSNTSSDCNLFMLVKDPQPAYFTLKTKKGEKAMYYNVDSRKDFDKPPVLKPFAILSVQMRPR